MLLNIQELRFGYTKHKLLFDNFSLSLNEGELIAVVGESGIGKSTLFELILGNLKPHKGELLAPTKVSEVFQDPYSSFHPSYTVLNQIKDVASLQGYEILAEQMHLEVDLLRKYPHELSGGQLQRCSILRALLMKPQLLLLDEPTSALDNVTQLEVMKLLMRYLSDMGMLLITHDLDLAKWCADDIVVLK